MQAREARSLSFHWSAVGAQAILHQYSLPAITATQTANSARWGLPSTKHVRRGTLTSSEPIGAVRVINKAMEKTVRKCQESIGAGSQDHNLTL